MSTVLVTGVAGNLARLTAERLVDDGHEVIGVDYRHPRALRQEIIFYQANYNKARIEDVVRRHQPSHVLHLGRVGNLKVRANKRFDLNVIGSAKITELCLKHNVQRLVVLSTFHIYGAHPDNHIPISEDEPLRAAQKYPQLGDAVQLDSMASNWVYRHRDLRTAVLRPTNIVGPNIRNAISTYLRRPTLVCMLGFSPMWQFIHERDMVSAILEVFENDTAGIYNVAGRDAIPLIDALELTGAPVIPIPAPAADLALRLGRAVLPSVPPYLLDFFKYPCVISDEKFRTEHNFEPQVTIEEAIRSTLRGA